MSVAGAVEAGRIHDAAKLTGSLRAHEGVLSALYPPEPPPEIVEHDEPDPGTITNPPKKGPR